MINTGEYCAEVVPQLEQMIKQKIITTLADKVDMTSEVDAFNDFVAFALKVLINGIMDRLDLAFRAMMQMPWATMNHVDEESSYCFQIANILKECVPKIKESLSTSYFNNFCTKLATEILARLVSHSLIRLSFAYIVCFSIDMLIVF